MLQAEQPPCCAPGEEKQGDNESVQDPRGMWAPRRALAARCPPGQRPSHAGPEANSGGLRRAWLCIPLDPLHLLPLLGRQLGFQ